MMENKINRGLPSIILSLAFLGLSIILVIALFALASIYGPIWNGISAGTSFPVFTLRLFEFPVICLVTGIIILVIERFWNKFYLNIFLSATVFSALAFCLLMFASVWKSTQLPIYSGSYSENGVQIFIDGVMTLTGRLLDFHSLAMTVFATFICGLVWGLFRRLFS